MPCFTVEFSHSPAQLATRVSIRGYVGIIYSESSFAGVISVVLLAGGMADPHEVAHERPTALSCLQQTLPHTLSSQSGSSWLLARVYYRAYFSAPEGKESLQRESTRLSYWNYTHAISYHTYEPGLLWFWICQILKYIFVQMLHKCRLSQMC